MIRKNSFHKVTLVSLSALSVSMPMALANDQAATPAFEISVSNTRHPNPGAVELNLNYLGAPYREDVKKMNFRFAGAQINTLFARLSETRKLDKEQYYFEFRELKSASLRVTEDNRRDVELASFSLMPNEDLNALVTLKNPATNVSVSAVGEQERFKCFTPETCVFDGMEKVSTSAVNSVVDIIKFETIGTTQAGEAVLQRRISNPSEQQVVITESGAITRLGRKSFTGLGSSASSLDQFKGFAQTLEKFGNGDPLTVAHIFPAYGGLKISVETAPHYFCHFQRVISYPENFSVPTQLGRTCSFPGGYDGRTYVTGSSPGSDTKIVQDWLFQNLQPE
jgi:hypothetical protein